MARLKLASGVSLMSLMLCLSSPAHAQSQRVGGPFAGLFNGGKARDVHSLDLRGSAFGSWADSFVPPDAPPELVDPLLYASETFAGANAAIDYAFARTGQNGQIGASAVGGVSTYSVDLSHPQYNASGNFSAGTSLARRLSFNGGASAGYSPFYNIGPTLGAPSIDQINPGPGFAAAAAAAENVALSANAGLGYGFSSRTRANFDVSLAKTLFFDDAQSQLASLSMRAGLSHSITKKATAHVGYGRSLARDKGTSPGSTSNLDFGVDYGSGLQLTRRTTFSFSTAVTGAKSSDGATHYALVGTAALARGIGRSWSSGINYARTLGFAVGFQEPVLSDSVGASLGGLLTRKLSFTSSLSWSRNEVGFNSDNHFTGLSASAGLSTALTRRMGLFVSYGYAHSDVTQGISTLPFLSESSRQMVSVGINVWQPLMSSAKR